MVFAGVAFELFKHTSCHNYDCAEPEAYNPESGLYASGRTK